MGSESIQEEVLQFDIRKFITPFTVHARCDRYFIEWNGNREVSLPLCGYYLIPEKVVPLKPCVQRCVSEGGLGLPAVWAVCPAPFSSARANFQFGGRGPNSWQPIRVESDDIIQNEALNLVHSSKSPIIPVKACGLMVDGRGQLDGIRRAELVTRT
jgi:hypothetical protein